MVVTPFLGAQERAASSNGLASKVGLLGVMFDDATPLCTKSRDRFRTAPDCAKQVGTANSMIAKRKRATHAVSHTRPVSGLLQSA